MNSDELKERTKRFALRIVKLSDALPSRQAARVMGGQVLRSGTSVAANYRAACRARSHAEFISKIGIVVEEADETVFWLELLAESEIVQAGKLSPLLTEAKELLAIFAASQLTAKHNRSARTRSSMSQS
jgi:four helix bundle protein